MAILARTPMVLSVSMFLVTALGTYPAFSEPQEKEAVTEKPSPQAPSVSEGQPSLPKAPTEPKPQPQPAPPTKADSSTDHKETVPEKPASRQPQAPPVSDGQSAPLKPSTDAKPPTQSTPATKADSSTDRKEPVPEKQGSRSQQSAPAAEGHAAPHKPITEPKLQPQPAPATKGDIPLSPSEQEIKEKELGRKTLGSLILSVKLALMGDARVFHYEIEVEDEKQTVTLSGRVSSDDEKAAVAEVAQAVQGVKTVINKLVVDKDLAKALLKKQDETLTALIKERFAKSATLKAANFEVKTEGGVVQLYGTVRFQVLAFEAAEAARQIPGVRAVNTEKIRLEGEG
ncbi:MAG TPA: BON domain-containing protein [Nitrospira sp.]|nr:BON domain-containing protein [Nitrospira sp.]